MPSTIIATCPKSCLPAFLPSATNLCQQRNIHRRFITVHRPRFLPFAPAHHRHSHILPCNHSNPYLPHEQHQQQRQRQQQNKQPSIASTPSPSAAQYPIATGAPSLARILSSLWQFSRPHTVYGTLLSVLSVSTLALQHTGIVSLPLKLSLIPSLLTALLPALLLNVFIVGLNQLHDIPIDRINKPHLPLPAGRMTIPDARATIIVSLLAGLAFCLHPLATPALRIVLLSSALLGTLYSAPPFRLKRFALLASMAILTVRGLLVNIFFYLHMATAAATAPTIPTSVAASTATSAAATAPTVAAATISTATLSLPTRTLALPPPIAFAAAFFTFFGIVIALLKDVPDIKGDRLFGIRTFSVTVGASTIFRACVFTLCAMFLTAALFYFHVARAPLARVAVTVLHIIMAVSLAVKAKGVDPAEKEQVTRYYMFSWKAFYAEYALLPLAGF